MNDRTMIKVNATETCLVFRTVSPKRKSPRSFYVLRSELERLEQYGSITASDLGCFAVFQQDTVSGLVRIRFSWLQQNSACELAGYEETAYLPFNRLMGFAARSLMDPALQWSALSVEEVPKPRMVFHGRETLHATLSHKAVRRKLIRFLRDNFQWGWSDEVRFYNDFLPYSFFFTEIRGGQQGICGGLILHGREDLNRAYYSIHT